MGCCFSRDQQSIPDSEDFEGQITIGKNRPLLKERLKWRSEMALTEGQLRSKRDEFWETAPAFEGRKEIWDALRAATTLAEQGDWALAQAILDGANISLPDGTLRDSYDELGNRYQVPIYCLFNPINLIEKESESSVTSGGQGPREAIEVSLEPPPGGKPVTLKLRLSTTGNDIKMDVKTTESVLSVKKRLARLVEGVSSDPHNQRWYYGGRYLSDKMTIENCNIPSGFVVQVVVRSEPDPIRVYDLTKNTNYTTTNNNLNLTENAANGTTTAQPTDLIEVIEIEGEGSHTATYDNQAPKKWSRHENGSKKLATVHTTGNTEHSPAAGMQIQQDTREASPSRKKSKTEKRVKGGGHKNSNSRQKLSQQHQQQQPEHQDTVANSGQVKGGGGHSQSTGDKKRSDAKSGVSGKSWVKKTSHVQSSDPSGPSKPSTAKSKGGGSEPPPVE